MNRRDFLKTLMTGTAGAVFLQACGGGSDSSSGGGAAESTGPATDAPGSTNTGSAISCNEVISANHGHTLEVSAADLEARTEKTYDIQGSSSHPHLLTVTAADFEILQSGGSVTKTSTTDAGHAHDVTIQCA